MPVPERLVNAEAAPSSATLDDVERALIARTLEEVDGNVSKVARRLSITRARLRYRVEECRLIQNECPGSGKRRADEGLGNIPQLLVLPP